MYLQKVIKAIKIEIFLFFVGVFGGSGSVTVPNCQGPETLEIRSLGRHFMDSTVIRSALPCTPL